MAKHDVDAERNELDEKIIHPYMFPVAENARCFDDASPIKNPLEYNRLNDFESILSCISRDLYDDVLDSHKKRP